MKKIFLAFAAVLAFSLSGSAFVPPPADIGTLSKEASVKRFPDADTVVLYSREHCFYKKDGTGCTNEESFIKILTEKGRESLRHLTFYFNTNYNRIKLRQISVIHPDGSRTEVDIAKNSRTVIDSSQMSSNIYDPANRLLNVTIPALKAGDILHYRVTDETFKTRIPDFWSNYILLQHSAPIIKNIVVIDSPAELPLLSAAVKDRIPGTVTFSSQKNGSRIISTWTARNVPQVMPEPGMPEAHTCVQRLLVSTAKSWQEVSQWYWQLCRPRLDAVTPAMKEKVKELISGKKSDLEKVTALFQFVSQNIRYMGITPEKEAPGYEPHDVRMTFEQRYGVCRDKAALLTAMLELAGFKAYPVLFMAGSPKDDEIPNGYFNHAVTAVELAPGKYTLMDPTYESTSELFPAFQSDMSYLVAHPRGEVLRRSPVVPAAANRISIRTKAEITAETALKAQSVLTLKGVNDIYYRGALSRWRPEQLDAFFSNRLQKVLPGVKIDSVNITPANIRDMSVPLQIILSYTVPAGERRFSNPELPLMLPELSRVFGIREVLFSDASLLTRRYPLKLMSSFSSDEECELRLPETIEVAALPQAEHLSVGGKAVWYRTPELKGRTYRISSSFQVNALEISADEYPSLKKLLHRSFSAVQPLPVTRRSYDLDKMQKVPAAFPGADSVVENYEAFINVQDQSSWEEKYKIRRRILNYAGVKAHSEVKIRFYPVWEKVDIKAVVTSPDGKKYQLGAKELNLMDSPESGSAPRYPAGKVLVASLPGVHPGSVVDLEISRQFRNRHFFSRSIPFFSRSGPTLSCKLTVVSPDRMFLNFNCKVPGAAVQEYSEDGKRYRILQAANLPRLYSEPGQPDWRLFAPGVMLSVGNNRNYAEKLNQALQKKAVPSPAVTALVQKEKWHQLSDTGKVLSAIRDYVDKNIRSAGPAAGAVPFSALTAPEITLQSGYGNSADRAILISSILKVLKIEHRFTAAGGTGFTNHYAKIMNFSPDPERFTGNILVYIPKSKCYLNDTGRYAKLGTSGSENMAGLDLSSGRIYRIRPFPQLETEHGWAFYIRCASSGQAEISVTETLRGNAYADINRFLSTATPERRRRFFEERAFKISPMAKLDAVPESNMKNYPGILSYKLTIPNYLLKTGDYLILPLPRYDLLRSAGFPVCSIRRTPYWRNSQTRQVISYNIEPPSGFKPGSIRPERIDLGRYGSAVFSESFTISGSRIALQSRQLLPVELVQPLDFCELEHRYRYLSLPGSDRIVFRNYQVKGNK